MKRIFLNNPYDDEAAKVYFEFIKKSHNTYRGYVGKIIKSNVSSYAVGTIINFFNEDYSTELTEKEIDILYKEIVFE